MSGATVVRIECEHRDCDWTFVAAIEDLQKAIDAHCWTRHDRCMGHGGGTAS